MAVQYRYSTGELIQNFSSVTYAAKLAATTNTTLTVPNLSIGEISSGKPLTPTQSTVIAVITFDDSTANVWISLNKTAVIPSSSSFVAEAGELIPSSQLFKKEVNVGDVINVITDTADVEIGIAFYQSF